MICIDKHIGVVVWEINQLNPHACVRYHINEILSPAISSCQKADFVLLMCFCVLLIDFHFVENKYKKVDVFA